MFSSRGLAPREGLEQLVDQLGRTRPLVGARRGPQTGKSGYPGSQDADSSPRAQGARSWLWGEALAKDEAPWAPKGCGPGWRVTVGWDVVTPLPKQSW